MGDVVTLVGNVDICTDSDAFAHWLESMAEAIRDRAIPVSSMLLVIENQRGNIGTYSQANGWIDTVRAVGLLHLAAQFKADRSEDDPLGIR